MSEILHVDVWSDVVCPWCPIGKRRLEEGRRRFAADHPGVEVVVRYHSFLLSPEARDGVETSPAEHLAAVKGVPRAQAEAMNAQITDLAAAEGLAYDLPHARHTSTLRAHELLHLAAAEGHGDAMVERLFRAYFSEGRGIGTVEDLVALAAEVGLDADAVRAALTQRRFADAVQADLAQAQAFGITGVPFAVVDGRYGVSGAQDPAVFAGALARAVEDRTPAVAP
ncbi:DsbA family oxidoreductase [Cellulomonas endophytica]|uniref:DsbA family oxidoreductase n=1 Tax=Cellulomonas endophytica TaxID=2494735 RepID=UPI0010101AA3|nr:DsbA family oxidoreductase [Cellulomonas endophytica]